MCLEFDKLKWLFSHILIWRFPFSDRVPNIEWVAVWTCQKSICKTKGLRSYNEIFVVSSCVACNGK